MKMLQEGCNTNAAHVRLHNLAFRRGESQNAGTRGARRVR